MGLDVPNGSAIQINNMVRDSIKADVTIFLHYKTIEEDGKRIIEIHVQCVRLIKKMVESGQLLQNGKPRNINYTLAK